jgi:hypothetical protein
MKELAESDSRHGFADARTKACARSRRCAAVDTPLANTTILPQERNQGHSEKTWNIGEAVRGAPGFRARKGVDDVHAGLAVLDCLCLRPFRSISFDAPVQPGSRSDPESLAPSTAFLCRGTSENERRFAAPAALTGLDAHRFQGVGERRLMVQWLNSGGHSRAFPSTAVASSMASAEPCSLASDICSKSSEHRGLGPRSNGNGIECQSSSERSDA